MNCKIYIESSNSGMYVVRKKFEKYIFHTFLYQLPAFLSNNLHVKKVFINFNPLCDEKKIIASDISKNEPL